MRFSLALLVAASAARAQPQPVPRPPGPPPSAQQPGAPVDRAALPAELEQPAAKPAGPGKPAPSAAPRDWTADYDEAWKHRDEDKALRELHKLLKAALASDPGSFEANWRMAELLNWQANGTEGELKASLGKGAWEAGDKAITARPEDVRGHYQGGTGIGLYSEGVGILTALSQGLEGKFRDRLQAALRIDKDYLDGAPQVVWGRYFYKLPWPKRDVGQSIKVLTEAVRTHPDNWRAKLYLADSLADDGRGDEAKKLVQEVAAGRIAGDAPEQKRLQDMAKKWLAQH